MAVTKFYPCNALILDGTQDQTTIGTEGIEDTWASTKQSYQSSDIVLDNTVPSLTDSYIRVELNKGLEYNGTHRSELRSHWNKTYEGWVSFRIYFPVGYVSDDATEILHQMHAIGGSPQISMQNRNNGLFFQTSSGTFADDTVVQYSIGDVVTGEWIDIIHNYRLDQVDGFLRVWRNGTQLVDYSGTLGYSDATEPPYRKFGIYKWLWSTAFDSSSTQRIVYYDQIKFADATATLSEMDPSPVNILPTVSITFPAEGATFYDTETIDGLVSASDSDGSIAQVEMFYNGTPANTELSAPYDFPLNLSAGSYALTAVATDNDGGETTSTAVNITVNHNTTIYVSPTGDDTNIGTEASPFLTASKAILESLPGDTILFERGGVYDSFTVSVKDGVALDKFTVNAYGTGDKPIISSFIEPSSWVNEGSNIWSYTDAQLTNVNVVRIGTTLKGKGRWPKTDYWYATGASGTTQITDTVNLSTSPNFVGGELVARKNKWVEDTQLITSQTSTTVTTEAGSSYPYQAEYGYFFQNHINCLTVQNDWMFDPSTNKISIYSTVDPVSLGISISKDQYALYLDSSDYWEFNDIVFEGAYDTGIYVEFSDNCKFTGCESNFNGIDGIKTYVSDDLTVINCDFDNIHNKAINIRDNSQRFSITDSRWQNIGLVRGMTQNGDGAGIGLFINNTEFDATIDNNYFYNIGYSGIYYRGNNCQVTNNYGHNICMRKADGAVYYTFGNATTAYTNILVQGNIGFDCIGNIDGTPYTEADGSVYYIDDNSKNITLDKNYGAGSSYGIYVHNVQDLTITNNRAIDNRIQFRFADDSIALDVLNNAINNNILVANTGQLIYEIISDYGDPYNYGTINNNQFDPATANSYRVYHVGTSDVTGDLAFWRTETGFDSTSSEIAFSQGNVEVLYNPLSTQDTFNLAGTYTDLNGVDYVDSITLDPNESIYLYKTPTANIEPDVAITYPINGRVYREGNALTITATASDSDGTITKVQFYQDDVLLGESLTAPYSFEIASLVTGEHSLTAKATDNDGGVTISQPVNITVLATPGIGPYFTVRGLFKVINL